MRRNIMFQVSCPPKDKAQRPRENLGAAPLHARGLLARGGQLALQRHLLRGLLRGHALQLRLLQVQQLRHLRAHRLVKGILQCVHSC